MSRNRDLEALEDRRLLAAPRIVDGILLVDGDAGNDQVTITLASTGYRVFTDNKIYGFDKKDVKRVKIRSRGGDDKITIAPNVPGVIIQAGDGNDTILGGQGRDTIDAGEGNDRVNANAGNDLVRGGAGKDKLRGGDGNDALEGGEGNDLLTGDAGNDTLVGDLDDSAAAHGADTLTGGTGLDWALYTPRNQPLTLSLDGKSNDGYASEKDNLAADIENLAGGASDDVIVGSAAPNRIAGNAGDDSILGGGGNDILEGFAGSDTLFGQDGNDTLASGGGDDSLYGNNGNDAFFTRDATQTFLDGGAGEDWSQHDIGLDRVRFIELRG